MARIKLLSAPAGILIFFEGVVDEVDNVFVVNQLVVDKATRGALPLEPFRVPKGLLQDDGGDTFHFKPIDTEQPFEFRLKLEAGQTLGFLGFVAGTAAEASLAFKIYIPKIGQPNPADRPFLHLELCGRLATFAGKLFDLDSKVCYELTIQDLPAFDGVTVLPELSLSFPSFHFKLPKLRIPNWHLPDFPTKPFQLPALQIDALAEISLPFTITWESLTLSFNTASNKTTIDIKNARISIKQLSQLALRGDAHLVFTNDGKLVAGESYFKRYEPSEQIILKGLYADAQCIAVNWDEPHINRWLAQLAPNLRSKTDDGKDVTARVLFGDPGSLQEIRFDWSAATENTEIALPGLDVSLPAAVRRTLIVRNEGGGLKRFALCATLAQDATATLKSKFAWMREDERELHNDEASDKHLFELMAKAKKAISLDLIDFNLGASGLPKFLRQLPSPIQPLDLANPDSLKTLVDLSAVSLSKDDWEINFKINPEIAAGYILPFLRLVKPVGEAIEQIEQFIKVVKRTTEELKKYVDFPRKEIHFPLDLNVGIGSFELETEIQLVFNWEKGALKFDHPDQGIPVYSKERILPKESKEVLGLTWQFKGAPVKVDEFQPDGSTIKVDKFQYFVLNWANHNYRLAQADHTTFEVQFTRASKEPIIFTITEFALLPKGIDMTATVSDSPVRLNGIDTKFRFHGSQMVLRENRFNSLTLAGSGPLPPELVGEATADIALQFEQIKGRLTLVCGHAELKGQKLLDCKQTRFQFSIDAIGLEFKEVANKFHLYFLLTGSAQFVPAPGDDLNWALALLGKIRIDLVDAPLTGDARVLARHIQFLVNLPSLKSFNFLGCFSMELRGIGFIPQADVFGGDPAMILTGQVKFAQGPGDNPDGRTDYHKLYIGLPSPGSLLPRIHFKDLPLSINLGAAFSLNGEVEFYDTPVEKGFSGEGVVEIKGLPPMAASFSFLRVRENENAPWVRAWFIYLELRKVSFMIPVLEIYIREIGFGFGYRYTIASIKKADETQDVRELLKELTKLSRTQGDLSKRDRWAVDLEKGGLDPRWTVVFRALISQTSASQLLSYNTSQEENLTCIFLFDAIVALRSDLTFFMSARAWLNTNYNDFFINRDSIREHPLVSGFVLLSPRQKRFLAHVASNPEGRIGSHPELPQFMKDALTKAQFSATLLIEEGLFHYEMGWPNMLRWDGDFFGILKAEYRGGFIFRISRTELVNGISFLARASLKIEAGLDFGFFGVRVSARADVAFGARYIGVIDFHDPLGQSALYGAIGLEIRISISIDAWLRFKAFFCTITINFHLSVSIGFTAGLEIGLAGIAPNEWGLRGNGTLSLSVLGHDLHIGVHLGINEGKVSIARARTERFLQIGLEATDVEDVPGIKPGDVNPHAAALAAPAPGTPHLENLVAPHAEAQPGPAAPAPDEAAAEAINNGGEAATNHDGNAAPPNAVGQPDAGGTGDQPAPMEGFKIPGYSILVIRKSNELDWVYFALIPQGRCKNEVGDEELETGFLPVPPDKVEDTINDFDITIDDPKGKLQPVERANPSDDGTILWHEVKKEGNSLHDAWKANWNVDRFKVSEAHQIEGAQSTEPPPSGKLKDYLEMAFVPDLTHPENPIPNRDPKPLPEAETVEDARVQNPSDSAYEAAVRGTVEQFESSPFYKKDNNVEYEKLLDAAFQDNTTIFDESGKMPVVAETNSTAPPALTDEQKTLLAEQQAWHIRGMIVQEMIGHVKMYAEGNLSLEEQKISVPFQMGLVFRFKGDDDALDGLTFKVKQRNKRDEYIPNAKAVDAHVFNLARTSFRVNPPKLDRLHFQSNSTTICIAWNLTWNRSLVDADGDQQITMAAQKDPEHHLLHYHVQRKCLDGTEPDVEYTHKGADAKHRESTGVMKLLRRRFQLADHFQETAEDRHTLPAEGRSYLYTITPIDVGGEAGEAVSVQVTRRPDVPPLVPSDAKLIVEYGLTRDDFEPLVIEPTAGPGEVKPIKLLKPRALRVEWSQQSITVEQTSPPVAEHWIVFRREATLPIGSYGLDSVTQRPRAKSLPTTNARPLPTDIKIRLRKVMHNATAVQARIDDLGEIESLFPKDDKHWEDGKPWRPEAWRTFLQTVSVNGVASALAPVQIQLSLTPVKEDGFTQADSQNETDDRLPAELEWLPQPTQLPLLPAEDQRARRGEVLVPMPANGHLTFPESGLVLTEHIKFTLHPAKLRCVRFRWNQGPSARPAYPLELTAGYHLLELDADAHTTEIFEQPHVPAEALRLIQEAQMMSPEDVALTPNETLNANQWEAWYPSSIKRLPPTQPLLQDGSTANRGPWYSWRDSYLEWPEWPGFTADNGRRDDVRHPLLQEFLYVLTEDPLGRNNTEGDLEFYKDLLPPFGISLQTSPPMQPVNLSSFFKATGSASDVYGWGVLQRFGLSTAFSLRYAKKTIIKDQQGNQQERQEGDIVVGEELIQALNYVRNKYETKAIDFQLTAAKINELEEPLKPLIADIKARLSAIVNQIFYGREKFGQALRELLGSENLQKIVTVDGKKQTVFFLISDKAAGQTLFKNYFKYLHFEILFQPGRSIEIDTEAKVKPESLLALVQLSLRPTITKAMCYGRLKLSADKAADKIFKVKYQSQKDLKIDVVNLADATPLENRIDLKADQNVTREFPVPPNGVATLLMRGEDLSGLSVFLVQKDSQETKIALGILWPTDTTSEVARHFSVDSDGLASHFATDEKGYGEQWGRFKLYVESLNVPAPDAPQQPTINVPLDKAGILKALPDFLAWSQRFFDFSGDVKEEVVPEETAKCKKTATTGDGPWLATAYPRSSTPVAIAPDSSGRLTYDHLIADDWAHTYRYFIRPYGRYDMLWDGLRRKEVFQAEKKMLPAVLPSKDMGGLDIVFDRQHPVAQPLILSSRRLDAPPTPEKIEPPGKIWEVIVAEHPEQTLIERNQTLARQLAFRGIAFTLLRHFAFPNWKQELETVLNDGKTIDIELIEDMFPDAPSAYPTEPDQMSLAETADLRSIALPERLDNFQQGALVLQWEGLPFYYEHKLLIVAQTASNVSPINQVMQRDFEYHTPDPQPSLIEGSGMIAATRLTRVLHIPLRPFWESLPADARRNWPWEDPAGMSGKTKRLMSSLPDREVVYQIIETYSGNVEVQAEIYFDGNQTPPKYVARPLGKRWQVKEDGIKLLRPQKLIGRPPHYVDDPQGDFMLEVTLICTEEQETSFNLSVATKVDIPPAVQAVAYYDEPKEYALTWFGIMSPAEKDELLKISKGDPPFLAVLARLAATATTQGDNDVAVEIIPLHIEQVAEWVNDSNGEMVFLPEAGNSIEQLMWRGTFEDSQGVRLKRMAGLPADGQTPLSAAIAELLRLVDEQEVSVEIEIEATEVIVPPSGVLAQNLTITNVTNTKKIVMWKKALTKEKLDALKNLTGPPAYQGAIDEIIRRLLEPKVVAYREIRRPKPGELVTLIRHKLQLGSERLVIKAILRSQQAIALRQAFTEETDQKAVTRFYKESVFSSLKSRFGTELKVRTRRGSALVSTNVSTIQLLSIPQEVEV